MAWDPQPGDVLLATTATGEERECVAVSRCEGTHGLRPDGKYGKIHDFPVVWVRFPDRDERLPWPFESLRPSE